MATTNEELRNFAVRHKILLLRRDTQLYRELLEEFLNQYDKQLLDKIATTAEDLKTRGIGALRLKKYRQLEAFIDDLMGEQRTLAQARLRQELVDLANYEARWQVGVMTNTIPIETSLAVPTTSTLRAVVESEPIDGRFLRDWTRDWVSSKRGRVNQAIRNGFVEGQSASEMVRVLKGTRANNYRDGVLETSRRGLRFLIRTASSGITSRARELTYVENDDLIKGVQWVSTLDNRTTIVCQSRDGNVYRINDGPRPPAHGNCRSVTVPITKSFRELGIDLDEIPPATRPSVVNKMAGDVPSNKTYSAFLKEQDTRFQNIALGQKRAQLFRKGDLSLDSFVEEPSGRVYTLDELRRLEPEAWERTFGDT